MKHGESQEAKRKPATRKRPSYLLFAARITTALRWIRALLLGLVIDSRLILSASSKSTQAPLLDIGGTGGGPKISMNIILRTGRHPRQLDTVIIVEAARRCRVHRSLATAAGDVSSARPYRRLCVSSNHLASVAKPRWERTRCALTQSVSCSARKQNPQPPRHGQTSLVCRTLYRDRTCLPLQLSRAHSRSTGFLSLPAVTLCSLRGVGPPWLRRSVQQLALLLDQLTAEKCSLLVHFESWCTHPP